MQRVQQIGREGERDSLLLRAKTQVEITRQLVRRGRDFVVVKHHRQPRIRAQSLAAGTRCQKNPAQIHRHRADGADAIQAQLCPRSAHMDLSPAMSLSTPVEVSQCTHQNQAGAGRADSFSPTAARSSGSTPGKFQRFKIQIEPPGLVHQPAAKFAVAQNQAGLAEQRQLSGNHVVGQRARTHQQLDFRGTDEFAEDLFRGLKILFEALAAMRFRRLLEGAPDFAPHRHRTGQKIHRAGMKRTRGRRAQKFARRDFKRFQRHIHRLKLRVAAADERAEGHEAEVLIQFAAGSCRK